MIKDLWLNVPVKDISKTRDFFLNIGFELNHMGNSDHSACFKIGSKNVIMMFFTEAFFGQISQHVASDTSKGNEVMYSFDFESRGEVDEFANKVEAAGGIIFFKPTEIQGWMYGFGFTDPDGHRWNPMFMDYSKMKQ